MNNKIENYLNELHYNTRSVMCEIFSKHGGDKSDNHNYTTFYNYIFSENRDNLLNIFELGIGTNNPDLPSSMGINGRPGASLYGFREYFPNSQIFGADIDKNIIFESERIKTFFVDQRDAEIIKDMWSNIPEMFDIMLDDGLHEYSANINFLENSIHKLKDGGIYIIEDILDHELHKFENYVRENVLNLNMHIFEIPGKSHMIDNRIVIIQK
jgi:hypothetical protein